MTAATKTRVKLVELMCGYCSGGKHAHCPGAVRVPTQELPVLCRCRCTVKHCLDCGYTPADPAEADLLFDAQWACIDQSACQAEQGARRGRSPLYQQLQEVQEHSRRVMAEANARSTAARRAKREAERMVADVPVVQAVAPSTWQPVGKSLAMATGPKRTRELRPARPTSGTCRCCGEPTKGGNYLSGHDSRHLAALAAAVLNGSPVEVALGQLPSEALQLKLVKRLADAK